MNKVIMCSFSFITGGFFVYIKNNKNIEKIINENKSLTLINEKLSYQLNKLKSEIKCNNTDNDIDNDTDNDTDIDIDIDIDNDTDTDSLSNSLNENNLVIID